MGKLVIFFPGMGGSVLVHNSTQKQLYPSRKFKELRAGETSEATFRRMLDEPVSAGGPLLSLFTTKIYQPLFDKLASSGYTILTVEDFTNPKRKIKPNTNYLFGYGWDWTKSHSGTDQTAKLLHLIDLWFEKGGSHTIVAVGHSSGAMIPLYINGVRKTFSKIIAVDSPLNGTREAHDLLMLGECRFNPPGLSPAQLWQLSQMPASYALYELLSEESLQKLAHTRYPDIDKGKVKWAGYGRQQMFHTPAELCLIIPQNTLFAMEEMVPNSLVLNISVKRPSTNKTHALLLTSKTMLNALLEEL